MPAAGAPAAGAAAVCVGCAATGAAVPPAFVGLGAAVSCERSQATAITAAALAITIPVRSFLIPTSASEGRSGQ
jgi:hypothetical protein